MQALKLKKLKTRIFQNAIFNYSKNYDFETLPLPPVTATAYRDSPSTTVTHRPSPSFTVLHRSTLKKF